MGRKSGGEDRVPITVKLSEETLSRLDDFCQMNFHAERSTVIEEAIKLFLGQESGKRGGPQ